MSKGLARQQSKQDSQRLDGQEIELELLGHLLYLKALCNSASRVSLCAEIIPTACRRAEDGYSIAQESDVHRESMQKWGVPIRMWEKV